MRGDYELLERLRNREQAALALAIRRYSKYVAAVVKKTMGEDCTKQDMEELTSDAFVALWGKAKQLRDDSDLRYWLAVVARNAALRRREKEKGSQGLESNFLYYIPSPEGELERKERFQEVRAAVDEMEPVDREIFLRHYFWHQPVEQIAREMEKNQSAIKSRLSRGRERLRKVLAKEDCLL